MSTAELLPPPHVLVALPEGLNSSSPIPPSGLSFGSDGSVTMDATRYRALTQRFNAIEALAEKGLAGREEEDYFERLLFSTLVRLGGEGTALLTDDRIPASEVVETIAAP